MYQLLEAKLAADGNRDTPTRVMVGAMARGPMHRSSRPMRPLRPSNTSNIDAIIIAP